MNKDYIKNTASLQATKLKAVKADITKFSVNGTPFSKVVSANIPESPTSNDIWKYAATTDEEGIVTINTDVTVDYTELTDAQKDILKTTVKVIDNKVLDANDTLLMNWDTKNFTSNVGVGQLDEENHITQNLFGTEINYTAGKFSYAPITEWNSDLSSLTNGMVMFYGCSSLTSFNGDLSSLKNGYGMFTQCSVLTSFNADLSSLTDGYCMFTQTPLQLFSGDLSSLTNGSHMFMWCFNLTSFSGDLSSLTNGENMFYKTALESFSGDLSSLTNGENMFSYNSAFESFSGDLSSLTNGMQMFYKTALQSFSGDLPNLTDGESMFSRSTLQSFSGDLSNLVYGGGMFGTCKLDPQSVMIINDSIRDITAEKSSLTDSDYVTRTGTDTTDDPYIYSKPFGWMSDGAYVYTYHNPKPYTTIINSSDVGRLTIGINVTRDSSTINTQLQEFAEAAYYDSWTDLKQAFANKGWTVTWRYGGTDTSITLSDDEAFRGVPVWAKIKEVIPAGETYTKEEIANAEYCTEDGSKYYNISWGHDVNDEAKDETMTDETKFFYFGSLLEACGYWGVIPKQYLEA